MGFYDIGAAASQQVLSSSIQRIRNLLDRNHIGWFAAPFLTFHRSGSVPAVRKEKRMHFDAKEFGKRFHDVRTSRGITQEELAVRLGLASKQHVSTDYLLMGSEPSKEEVKNDLLSII